MSAPWGSALRSEMSGLKGSGVCSEMGVEDEGVNCRQQEDSQGGIGFGRAVVLPEGAVGFSKRPGAGLPQAKLWRLQHFMRSGLRPARI